MTDREFLIKGGIMGCTRIIHHVGPNTFTIFVDGITKSESARYDAGEFEFMIHECVKYLESQRDNNNGQK